MPGRVYTADELREPVQPVVLEWPEFQVMFAQGHIQGEHVAIVGPNGSGKTLLGLELCKLIGMRVAQDRRPSRVTVLSTKPQDKTVTDLGWPVIKEWPPGYGQEHVVVWPKAKGASAAARRHRAVFLPLLDTIYDEGGQTVYVPEAAYFERAQPNGLGMSSTMEQFWSAARSNELSLISDTQRPRHVTLLMWSEPAWLVIYPLKTDDDVKHVAKLSGRQREVQAILPQLGEHEFMCVRGQQGLKGRPAVKEIYVSRVDIRQVVTRDNRDKNRRAA